MTNMEVVPSKFLGVVVIFYKFLELCGIAKEIEEQGNMACVYPILEWKVRVPFTTCTEIRAKFEQLDVDAMGKGTTMTTVEHHNHEEHIFTIVF